MINSKDITEVYHVHGFAKAYFIVGDLKHKPSSVGLKLEIIPEGINKEV